MPMHPEDLGRFPEGFPQALRDSARSLPGEELIESVWKYEDIKKVINFLVDVEYKITGGDVYTEKDGQWFQPPDGWSVKDPDPRLLRERSATERKYILETSREQSLAYVETIGKGMEMIIITPFFSKANPHRTQHKTIRGW